MFITTIPEEMADIVVENIMFDYNEKQIKKMTYDDIAEYIIEYFKSVLLDDILDSIEAIDNGEFDDKYSKESIDRVRDDLMSMKIKLEQDKDDLFILYAL